MKLIACSFVALLLFAASCNTISNTAGTKFKKVTITDPGELFSTYHLKEDPDAVAAINAVKGITESEKDDIYKYATEENWPDGMATLQARLDNREEIKKYNAYLVTSFLTHQNKKMHIIKVPQSKNAHMKGKMALDHDIYIVISDLGIRK